MYYPFEEHFLRVGCAGFGIGGLYFCSYFYQLSRDQNRKAYEQKNIPQYNDLAQLKSDIKAGSVIEGERVIAVGTVVQHLNEFIGHKHVDNIGAAKRVVTYKCLKVKVDRDGNYEDKEIKIPDECTSVPCRLQDARGSSIRLDAIHRAEKFKLFLKNVYQRRLLQHLPPQLTKREHNNGVRIEDYILVFGTRIAICGTVKTVKDELFPEGDIVVTPHELNSTMVGFVHGKRLSAKVCKVIAAPLGVGGLVLLLYGIYPLLQKLLEAKGWSLSGAFSGLLHTLHLQ